jgi:ubiquinone/menaquinone biosynthesis C-methylase UbiE
MTGSGTPGNLQGMLRIYGPQTWDVYDFLDRSLSPDSSDVLLDVAGEYLQESSRILDAGCRDATHLISLVSRGSGRRGVGVDPVPIHIERARRAVAAAGLTDRIELVEGTMNALPQADGHFDLIWCRDVLEQVAELDGALVESARVLRDGGRMLVYTVFATDRLDPAEREMMRHHLGNVDGNLDQGRVEMSFEQAGLRVERRDVIGTEWREHAEERHRTASTNLLRLSRLRRQRDTIVARHGQDVYDHVEANLHWDVFQFLGKLLPVVYVLGKTPA